MRVISQDGTIDVPYDYFSLSIFSGKYKDVEVAYIYCHNLSSPNGTKLAEYSTEEKAVKAMEMLREAYAGKPKLNVDEIPNLTPQEFGEKLGIGDILLCDKVNADVSFSSNYYFQFPQDDEIEV
nr:MAG TPA: hypothetical protein [Caudoviricetes sp.]